MKVAIIKYNAGNICSVTHALERLGVQPIITDKAEEIRSADKVIFPGVGEAKSAMNYLAMNGLDLIIPELKQAVLGICLGMQLMCSYSEEGNTKCMNIFPLNVKRFNNSSGENFKIPHVGWNNIIFNKQDGLYSTLVNNSYVYFVHSFYAETGIHTTAETNYIESFSASLHKDNFYGVQYHPEKSGKTGEFILKNFLAL